MWQYNLRKYCRVEKAKSLWFPRVCNVCVYTYLPPPPRKNSKYATAIIKSFFYCKFNYLIVTKYLDV